MIRGLAYGALALVAGVVSGAVGATWWAESSARRATHDVRLVVTAGDDWYGQLHLGGCSVMPVDVYNAGDQPVAVSWVLATVTASSSLTCQPEDGHVTIAPRTTRTVRAVVGFRCQDPPAEPRFTAMTGEDEATPARGTIDMPPMDFDALCQVGQASGWYRSEVASVSGAGSNARLEVTLVFEANAQGTKVASISLESRAFELHPPRTPIDIASLPPGAASPEVPVEVSLSVRDCAKARDLARNDLTLRTTFTPSDEVVTTVLGEADRPMVIGLLQLVDAACEERADGEPDR